MKRILITGATGFLGSSLVSGLKNFEIVNVPRTENLDSFLSSLKGGFDFVIHTATDYGRNSLSEVVKTNIYFSVQLLDFAVNRGVPCFINCGTSLEKSVSNYALSKNQFSDWGKLLADSHIIKFLDLKIEQMYGSGQRLNTFIPRLISDLKKGVPEIEMTEGKQLRDFVHIDDVVAAIAVLLDNNHSIQGYKEVPIGSGKAVAVKDFAELASKICGAATEIKYGAVPYRDKECMSSKADLSLMSFLGWSPQITLESGLERLFKDISR